MCATHRRSKKASRALWASTVLCVRRNCFLRPTVIVENFLLSLKLQLNNVSPTRNQSKCISALMPPRPPSGALQRAVCQFEHQAFLTRDRRSPAAPSRRCHCAPLQPSVSEGSGPLLVVRGLASRRALRAALQPYCDSAVTGGSRLEHY